MLSVARLAENSDPLSVDLVLWSKTRDLDGASVRASRPLQVVDAKAKIPLVPTECGIPVKDPRTTCLEVRDPRESGSQEEDPQG